MDLLSVIRRWHHRDGLPIREVERRTGLSRNTIRTYLAIAIAVQAVIHHHRRVRSLSTIEFVNALEQEKASGKASTFANRMAQANRRGQHHGPDKPRRRSEVAGEADEPGTATEGRD